MQGKLNIVGYICYLSFLGNNIEINMSLIEINIIFDICEYKSLLLNK